MFRVYGLGLIVYRVQGSEFRDEGLWVYGFLSTHPRKSRFKVYRFRDVSGLILNPGDWAIQGIEGA